MYVTNLGAVTNSLVQNQTSSSLLQSGTVVKKVTAVLYFWDESGDYHDDYDMWDYSDDGMWDDYHDGMWDDYHDDFGMDPHAMDPHAMDPHAMDPHAMDPCSECDLMIQELGSKQAAAETDMCKDETGEICPQAQ